MAADNIPKTLSTSALATRKVLNIIALSAFANFRVLSAPENAWNGGSALVLSAPGTVQND